MDDSNKKTQASTGDSVQHHIRLPGFISEEEIGLGDFLKRVTYSVGVKPCGGCEQRAAILNRWLTFGPKKQ